jgi:hypothetical protein
MQQEKQRGVSMYPGPILSIADLKALNYLCSFFFFVFLAVLGFCFGFGFL